MSDPIASAYHEFETACTAMQTAAQRVHTAVREQTGIGPETTGAMLIIQEVVGRYFGYTRDQLCGESRIAPLVTARHLAIWLCNKLTHERLGAIAAAFGTRHHTTVLYSALAIENRAATEPAFAATLAALTESCTIALAGSASSRDQRLKD